MIVPSLWASTRLFLGQKQPSDHRLVLLTPNSQYSGLMSAAIAPAIIHRRMEHDETFMRRAAARSPTVFAPVASP